MEALARFNRQAHSVRTYAIKVVKLIIKILKTYTVAMQSKFSAFSRLVVVNFSKSLN